MSATKMALLRFVACISESVDVCLRMLSSELALYVATFV